MNERDPTQVKRFVVLPALNNFNANSSTESIQLCTRLAKLAARPAGSRPTEEQAFADLALAHPLRVVEQIDRAASIVEMTEEQRLQLTARFPGLVVRPEVWLRFCRGSPLRSGLKNARLPVRSVVKRISVSVVDDHDRPVKGVDILIVFNVGRRTGISGLITDERGQVTGPLPSRLDSIELITANPTAHHWPTHVKDVAVTASGITEVRLKVVPILAGFADGLARMVPPRRGGDGTGVKVAVIDAGVSAPAELKVRHALNTTGSEPETLGEDNGSGHGTHVAGIIRRLAPQAELHSYRVFTKTREEASEAAISRAIAAAVDANCDIINLSLGQDEEAISITRELRRARALGAVCVAAAGNDYGAAVSFPAWSDHALAISACGHVDGWPEGSSVSLDMDDDPAPLGEVFFAAFSNCGREIDFMMPGSGIVSWVSPSACGVMSGTSMAAPAATGLLACLLSAEPGLLGEAMPRDQARSDAIANLAGRNARGIGFGAFHEGRGIIGLP